MPREYNDARKNSNRKWDKENLDRMSIAVPKGKRDVIKAHAESMGESVNGFITRAIDEIMYEEGERKMIDIRTIERRFRYRLGKRGWTLHKETNDYGDPVYYITDDVDAERPDDNDNNRWFTFNELERYCAELAEEDEQYYAQQREERRTNRD